MTGDAAGPLVLWFDEVRGTDVALVGGKAASLGEMYGALLDRGVPVPRGFVMTVRAYEVFLNEPVPHDTWSALEAPDDLRTLRDEATAAPELRRALRAVFEDAPADDHVEMHARTALARALVESTPLPDQVREAIDAGYQALCESYGREVDAAVRSSATREDLEAASFAGQYESYLNVRGARDVLAAWMRCVASAFTERAVSYQLSRGMNPLEGSLAVVVMKMVRSDLATSGVMFTVDPNSGNPNVVHVTSSYGLGELVVQGSVQPDTFVVWKEGVRRGRPSVVHRHLGAKDRKLVYSSQGGTATESVDVEASKSRAWSLTDQEAYELAAMAVRIEDHYGRPMDIEWAKDGVTGELFVVQARPETVHSTEASRRSLVTYRMDAELMSRLRDEGAVILEGQAVGNRIGAGKVRVYRSYEDVIRGKWVLRSMIKAGRDPQDLPAAERVFDRGDVLVTELTTPDWEPLMKDASLIITEKGGRTSHAAIVAREFGIAAIVGCANATRIVEPLMEVTGSCAEGSTGVVYRGIQPWEVDRVELDEVVDLETRIKVNVGFPAKALQDAMLPVDGVGLARIEFILTAEVGIHPLALVHYEALRRFVRTGEMAPELERFGDRIRAEDRDELDHLLDAVERRTPTYDDRRRFFVDQLGHGIALICAAFHPRPVLVRLSDLKSNEYRELLAGRLFEPEEENPMIAWRGAARYVDPAFRAAFEMEVESLRWVRHEMQLDNLQVMVPFCRCPEEGRAVAEILASSGLGPADGVPLFLMVELPANVLDAEAFMDAMGLAGGSIGSNDLVQTVYAMSRDDLEAYPHQVDARSPAVKRMIAAAVDSFTARGLEIGICGQAPSDYPDEIPPFLVECGITSISVTPDTVLRVRLAVAEAEKKAGRHASEPAVQATREGIQPLAD